jgi:Holliday junction DNA helicase RuvA
LIGFIRGILVGKQPPRLLIDVHGMGYEVEAPMSTFYNLPSLGVELTLHTHLVVREDAHILYGFASDAERRLFRSLIRVNGVGPRLALTILSGASADEFARCVHNGDAAALTRLPGVGKKTAERLVVEMRDRLGETATGRGGAAEPQAPADEAQSALVALGYKPQEASRMLSRIEAANLSSEELIRRALQAAL